MRPAAGGQAPQRLIERGPRSGALQRALARGLRLAGAAYRVRRVPLHIWLLACAAALAVLSLPGARSGRPVVAGVATVIDGDTLEVRGRRIRLHAVDAPEARQTCRRGTETWRCGQEAALALADRVGRRLVRCEQTDTDRYRRIIARCSAEGEDLGAWLVGQGLAVAHRRYGRDYVEVETEAREARRGLWAGSFAMPWDWRAGG